MSIGNLAVYDAALAAVMAHPELHDQTSWLVKFDCGTGGCLFGHIALQAGAEPIWESWEKDTSEVAWKGGSWDVVEVGAELLELEDDALVSLISAPDNTVEQLSAIRDILAEAERARQDVKFGEQNHPDGTGPGAYWPAYGNMDFVADAMKRLCQSSGKPGGEGDSWFKVLAEEFTEAMAEDDSAKLRAELVQVAAVAVAWVECIDRREVAS